MAYLLGVAPREPSTILFLPVTHVKRDFERSRKGGLALVYSPRSNARGYDLITIYDDGDE